VTVHSRALRRHEVPHPRTLSPQHRTRSHWLVTSRSCTQQPISETGPARRAPAAALRRPTRPTGRNSARSSGGLEAQGLARSVLAHRRGEGMRGPRAGMLAERPRPRPSASRRRGTRRRVRGQGHNSPPAGRGPMPRDACR
jgi:hypothetical protein